MHTIAQDVPLYLLCSVFLLPELLLVCFADRVARWFNQRSSQAVSPLLVRVVGLCGLAPTLFAIWTIHLHIAGHPKYH